MSNCSNNYGPYHFPEKLIPLVILKALHGEPLPVYGKGDNVRDWLYVEDHARALHAVADAGPARRELQCRRRRRAHQSRCRDRDLRAARRVAAGLAAPAACEPDQPSSPTGPATTGAMRSMRRKSARELGWRPRETFETGLRETVALVSRQPLVVGADLVRALPRHQARHRSSRSGNSRSAAMTYPSHLIPTTVVGSYPQPDWLVDRARARTARRAARPCAATSGAFREPWREQAQDDATIVAIREMERAGIDIVTDGEIRRESYSNRFALALDGHRRRASRPVSGAAAAARRRCRASSARSAARGPVETRDAEFLLRARDARDQDHAAGAVHAVAAGAERVLCRRGGDGDGLRRRRQRGTARAEGDRGRCRAARRALGAHRAGEGGALRRRGDQPRARRHRRPDHRASVLRLRGDGARQADRLRLPAAARRHRRPGRSRSRRRSRISISAC